MPKKPRQRLDNLPERTRDSLRSKSNPDADNSGYYNETIPEPVPVYNQSPSEQVYKGSNNSFIIMGRDRPRGIGSGYGGAGASHSGCIDIVAGMTGIMCRSTDANGEEVVTDKSPELDAARIYISQQTDIDENFQLAAGVVGNLKARSGIAIKADGVRIIGREGIKLVTSSDNHDASGLWIGGHRNLIQPDDRVAYPERHSSAGGYRSSNKGFLHTYGYVCSSKPNSTMSGSYI